MTVDQTTCMGCCLNPGFVSPYGPHVNPGSWVKGFQCDQANSFQNTFQTSFPIFIDNLFAVKLTPEEMELLKKLGECYNMYCSLDKRSEADNNEFVDALHRLQQIIALRVARRANPEVWAQPE